MEEKRQIWSTADIIKNRNNWTLASDVELLKHIKSLSEKFVQKSRSISQSLSSFENDVYSTCTSVANINNHFEALSDTQFVENKVKDDGFEVENSTAKLQSEQREGNDNITVKLNEALNNGIQVLRTQYDIIAVTDSDSEEDEPPEVLLKARNPFMSRRLPYIIGSEEFSKHDHLGLVTSSEDEDFEKESEAEEEGEEDNTTYLKKETMKSDSIMNDIIKSRTQVIQISSDSENSENEKMEQETTQSNIYSQTNLPTSHNFMDHVNATLQNATRNPITPLVGDVFSSPPLPMNDDSQYMSDDERSDNYSDIFSPFKKESRERTMSSIASDKVDNATPKDFESNKILQKPSNMSDISQSSAVTSDSEQVHSDIRDSYVSAKAYGNKSSANLFSAINAELNDKFKKKIVVDDDLISTRKNYSSSTDLFSNAKPDDTSSPIMRSEKSFSSTNESETSKKQSSSSSSTSHKDIMANDATSKPELAPKFPISGAEDIYSRPTSEKNSESITSKPKKSTFSPKVVSLFDDEDDDSLDELFRSKNVKTNPDPLLRVDNSHKELFDGANDLFSNNKVKERISEKTVSKITLTSASSLRRKSDLFNDDSDSGDDIFAIIRNQKKSAPDIADLRNEKMSISSHDHKVAKNAPTEAGRTIVSIAEKTEATASMFESDNVSKAELTGNDISYVKSVGERSVDLKSKNKYGNLFNTDDESDDLFPISTKNEKDLKSSKLNEKLLKTQKNEFEKDTLSTNEFTVNPKLPESKIYELPIPIAKKPNSILPKESSVNSRKEENASSNSIDDILASKVVKNTIEYNASDELSTGTRINKLPRGFEETSVPTANVKDSSMAGEFHNNQSSITKVPAKLAANRGLNINVNALLPGSNWSSITKLAKESSTKPVLEESLIPATSDSSGDAKLVEKSQNLSTSIAKDRLKVSGKRRPPSRHARLNKALQSDLFATNPAMNVDDDTSKIMNQTAFKSNLPEDNAVGTEKNTEEIKDFLLPTKKEISSLFESESESEPASDSISSLKDRLKISGKRRPPSRHARLNKALQSDLFATISTISVDDDTPKRTNQTASKSNIRENNTVDTEQYREEMKDSFLPTKKEISFLSESDSEPTSDSISFFEGRKESVQAFEEKQMAITQENRAADNATEERTKENKTANDLGNILITASSSREPPALMDDVSSLLNDSDRDEDKDEYLFDDAVIENQNINDSIPQLDREKSDELEGVEISSSLSATETARIEDPTSVPFKNNRTNVLVQESTLANISDNLPSQTLQTSSSPAFSETVGKLVSAVVPQLVSDVLETPKNKVESECFRTNAYSSPIEKADESSLKKVEKLSSNLFSIGQDESDDDFDKLFSKVKTPSFSISSEQSQSSFPIQVDKEVKNEKLASKMSNLSLENENKDEISEFRETLKFDTTSGEKNLFPARSDVKKKKSSNDRNKINTDLFAEDDDDGEALFSSNNKQFLRSSRKSATKNLFEDNDDDDDLFGSAIPSRRKISNEITNTTKSTNSFENMRVVKLRGQTIEKDPLTGEIIKK